MKTYHFLLPALVTILAVLLAGCTREAPLATESPSRGDLTHRALAWTDPVMIDGYLVRFDGRDFSNNQTTFSYNVSGTGVTPTLSHFTIELPPCAGALISFSPTSSASIGTNMTTGIFGIKWDLQIGPDDNRDYSITFAGDVPLRVVRASVKAGQIFEVGVIPGPCKGFEISGTVFVDSDSSGVQDPAEAGIAGVTVTLVDADGNVLTETTDQNGNYTFFRLAGTHTVRIDFATAAVDFNEELGESFDATTLNPLSVTVGPDSPDNDFGFKPQADELITKLEAEVLLTNGASPKFWAMELKAASRGRSKEFDAATLLAFLLEIETLFFPDPYQFADGNEFQGAQDILNIKSKDPVLKLLKQLLATELNHVSGKGLIGEEDLQEVLISWAESLIIAGQLLGFGPAGAGPTDDSGEIKKATKLLSLVNNARGGGGGGQ